MFDATVIVANIQRQSAVLDAASNGRIQDLRDASALAAVRNARANGSPER
jgi:hypothetical protein